jgi:hypothetical protein
MNNKVQLAAWVDRDSDLYRKIIAESETRHISISDIIRLSLSDRYSEFPNDDHPQAFDSPMEKAQEVLL